MYENSQQGQQTKRPVSSSSARLSNSINNSNIHSQINREKVSIMSLRKVSPPTTNNENTSRNKSTKFKESIDESDNTNRYVADSFGEEYQCEEEYTEEQSEIESPVEQN